MITFNTEQVTKNTTSKDLEALNAGCPEVKLQEKSVEYTQNAEYVVSPDAGYDGLSKVNVSVDLVVPTVQNSKTVNITKNGSTTVKPDTDYDVVKQVVVNTNIPLQEKQVDVLLSEPTTVVLPDTGYTGITKLTVNHSPVEANTAYTANKNGSYTIHPSEGYDATTSVNLTVNVPATPVEPTKSVEITQNGTTNIIPADGYDAIEGVDVTVNVPSKEEETKSVSYTSNGSYTVQPTEGKTLSEVSVSVNVPSSGALDISNKFVNCVNQTITQSDIDAFTGWENLTDGSYKFYNTKSSSTITALVLPSFSGLTNGDFMFANSFSGRFGPLIDLSNVDFSSVMSARYMFNQAHIIPGPNFKLFAGGDSSSIFKGAYIDGGFNHSAFYKDDNTYLRNASHLFYQARISYSGTLLMRFNSNNYNSAFAGVSDLEGLSLELDNPGGINGVDIESLTRQSSITELTLTLPNSSTPNTYGELEFLCFAGDNLVNLTINVINNSVNFGTCNQLTQDSVNNILNALADVTAEPKTITFAATQYGYVTEEQKAAATAKGWTINQA